MIFYDLARKVNAKRKQYLKKQAGQLLSPVRRIEFVAPPSTGRFCAMTFDDGPCALASNPPHGDAGLTETLLQTLEEYGAKGTFDVVGNTGDNYPDEEGKPGDFSWSGVQYDHYPQYGQDQLAGAANRPELVKRILEGGHEITNHSYVHRLFGPQKAVYAGRHHFQNLDEVVEDLRKLHSLLEEEYGYRMKLGRPPHYIDKIPAGGTAYDAYRVLGYNYMAASYDGGGWLPSDGDYDRDVEKMVEPLKRLLEENPDSLNGQIIFQKDGCNMSLQTPIADALPRQLELLKQAGYQVITVSQLLEMSPFEDVADTSFEMPFIRELLAAGHTVGYRNNSFQGDRMVTVEELMLMLCPPDLLRVEKPLDYNHLVHIAKEHAQVLSIPWNSPLLLGNVLLSSALHHGVQVEESHFKDQSAVPRKYVVEFVAGMVRQYQTDVSEEENPID